MTISTSIWSVRHPNAGQNIQHSFLHFRRFDPEPNSRLINLVCVVKNFFRILNCDSNLKENEIEIEPYIQKGFPSVKLKKFNKKEISFINFEQNQNHTLRNNFQQKVSKF